MLRQPKQLYGRQKKNYLFNYANFQVSTAYYSLIRFIGEKTIGILNHEVTTNLYFLQEQKHKLGEDPHKHI